MFAYILFAFVVTVAHGGNQNYSPKTFSSWQALAIFNSQESCEDARKQLGQPDNMRCIKR